MPKKVDKTQFNWLREQHVGCMVHVTGHHSGDFTGMVKYGGRELAIITDQDGVDREVCYIRPVRFTVIGKL